MAWDMSDTLSAGGPHAARHACACRGHPRLTASDVEAWMAGTSPAMTWNRTIRRMRSGRLLALQAVDELDELDGGLVVLRRDRGEALVLAVGELVEGGLVLLRRLLEGLGDGLLQVRRQVGEIGVRRALDEVRLVDDPEVLLLRHALVGH